jgi:hypothetical protein
LRTNYGFVSLHQRQYSYTKLMARDCLMAISSIFSADLPVNKKLKTFATDTAMNTRIQLLCVWAGPVFLLVYGTVFWLAGYLPPHPPSTSAVDVAAFYDVHLNQIRAGQIICLISSTLLFPWFAIISAQMARIEGRFPVLAMIQFGGGVLPVVFFTNCSMIWIAVSFRAGLVPHSADSVCRVAAGRSVFALAQNRQAGARIKQSGVEPPFAYRRQVKLSQ